MIFTSIHWSNATKKQQIYRIFFAIIDWFLKRMWNLHRDENFNNALNRVKNTLLKFKTQITIHRYWSFHDLTNEDFVVRKWFSHIFFLFRNMQKLMLLTKIYGRKEVNSNRKRISMRKVQKSTYLNNVRMRTSFELFVSILSLSIRTSLFSFFLVLLIKFKFFVFVIIKFLIVFLNKSKIASNAILLRTWKLRLFSWSKRKIINIQFCFS